MTGIVAHTYPEWWLKLAGQVAHWSTDYSAAVIKLKFQLDPYSRCMFAFCNRRRTLIKILQWDGSGFWILMKRLDRDAFHWPDTPDELRQVTLKEMHWLCDGLSLDQKDAFEEHHPKIVV